VVEAVKKLEGEMYNYPIFKHLIQFSNKVDANGHLI
jgi:hypothetical protein